MENLLTSSISFSKSAGVTLLLESTGISKKDQLHKIKLCRFSRMKKLSADIPTSAVLAVTQVKLVIYS